MYYLTGALQVLIYYDYIFSYINISVSKLLYCVLIIIFLQHNFSMQ